MKMRELFSPIPKEIFKNDDVRERVEIFLVLFVVASLGFKFVKGNINDYQSLDDHNIALAVFVNAAIVAAFLFAYRYDARKDTVISSNLGDEELVQKYGLRIFDRIIETYDRITYEFKGCRKNPL